MMSGRNECLEYENAKRIIDQLGRKSYNEGLTTYDVKRIKSAIDNCADDFTWALKDKVKYSVKSIYFGAILGKENNMTLLEKAKFIIGDFMNVMDGIGNMPGEKILAEKWFAETFLPAQSKFMMKYMKNSMYHFAEKLALAYGDAVEAEMKYMFTPPDTLNN